MTHDDALDIITSLYLYIDVKQNEIDDAKRHIATCMQCIRQLDITHRLLTGEKSTLAHDASQINLCTLVESKLSEFVTGVLDIESEEYILIEKHIKTCGTCQKKREMLTDTIDYAKLIYNDLVLPHTNLITSDSIKLWQYVEAGFKKLSTEISLLIKNQAPRFNKIRGYSDLTFFDPDEFAGAILQTARGPAKLRKSDSIQPNSDIDESKLKNDYKGLQLIDPENNVAIKAILLGTNSIKIIISSIDLSQPIEHVRVSITNKNSDQLMQYGQTNQAGEVLFENIDFISDYHYMIRMLFNRQRLEFDIRIKSPDVK